MRLYALASICLLLGRAPLGGDDGVSDFNIPKEVRGCLTSAGSRYRVSGRINPFYLRGDFRGDGKIDVAILLTAIATGEKGVVVCGTGFAKSILLGAGSSFHQMKDLGFDAWHVHPKGPVRQGAEAGAPPVLRGEALLLEWSESASGLVYWDGKTFRWYQQGD
jgi:hypothetical protein